MEIKRSSLEEPKRKGGIGKIIWNIIVFLLLIGAIGAAIYFYMNYKQLKDNPQVVGQDEIRMVTEAVGKFMDLPEGEEANLATVLDKEKLKEQDFFKRAENGDKVLIYVKARKAILYRPSTKRVIEVAPLSIGTSQMQNQPATTEQKD